MRAVTSAAPRSATCRPTSKNAFFVAECASLLRRMFLAWRSASETMRNDGLKMLSSPRDFFLWASRALPSEWKNESLTMLLNFLRFSSSTSFE